MTDRTEFTIDRPVTGDPSNDTRRSTPQITGSEFLAEIDAMLDLPGVAGLIWEQYTPYFNDGDPCEFSVGDVRILTGDDAIDEDKDEERDSERGLSTYDLYTDGVYLPNYRGIDHEKTSWVTLPDGGNASQIYTALRSLRTGAWEAVALENFGDHATVVATRDGFHVEAFYHD